MSLLNDASLILVPSAIKTGELLVQKPLPNKFADETGNYDGNDPQGSANLTFTRASNASRVNSDGLVERVRTNILLYSQDYTQTAWTTLSNATLSSTTTVTPAGTTDAVRVTSTAATQDLRQVLTITNGVAYTNSAYIRRVSGTGTVSILDVNGAAISITLTSEWQRFSATGTAISTTGRFYVRLDVSGDVIEVWGCQMEVSDFGPTDYIPTTTSARSTFAGITVDGTSVPNVPRLDYSGGASCPSLLLEPQRTNLVTYSEQFDNAVWNKQNLTITANDTTSPDGYVNADKLTESSDVSAVSHYVNGNNFSVVTNTIYTFSVFAKSNGRGIQVRAQNASGNFAYVYVNYDLTLGVVDATAEGNAEYVDSDIQDYGNGWYRCILQMKYTDAGNTLGRFSAFTYNESINNHSYTGNGTSGIYLYGAQVEQGSYSSSYIGPTLGSAVTRLADAASKTGISSLIGQTEGTIYLNVQRLINQSGVIASVTDGSNNNRLRILTLTTDDFRILFQLNGNIVQYDQNVAVGSVNDFIKIAIAYKSGDIAVYVNGTLANSSSNALTISSTLIDYALGGVVATNIKEALLFPTRLTNAQLAELTTL
jgi:hypothetical protein